MKKLIFILFALGLIGTACRDKEPTVTTKKWTWTRDEINVTLTFYLDGENEGKFYSSVTNGNLYILFADDTWTYYKIQGDTMYIKYSESDWNKEWFIHQHTGDVFELEYTGVLPTIPIVRNYLFKAQN